MKKLLLLLAILLFSGSDVYYGVSYIPMLMDRSQLEVSVEMVSSSMPIRNPGRIYVYQNWLMLVEQYKGIHLIDNTDPVHPVRRAFLKVPGCQSLAVGNGILYVDNAVDLVGVKIDFSSLQSHEVARNRMALPEINSPNGFVPWEFSRANRPENTEIVGWSDKTAVL
ncbi:MAG TPA: hypothetical protein VFP20_07015 [Bacteroidales bacterium]|nr:hypothetical protein [Bacteroidales bacterium]